MDTAEVSSGHNIHPRGRRRMIPCACFFKCFFKIWKPTVQYSGNSARTLERPPVWAKFDSHLRSSRELRHANFVVFIHSISKRCAPRPEVSIQHYRKRFRYRYSWRVPYRCRLVIAFTGAINPHFPRTRPFRSQRSRPCGGRRWPKAGTWGPGCRTATGGCPCTATCGARRTPWQTLRFLFRSSASSRQAPELRVKGGEFRAWKFGSWSSASNRQTHFWGLKGLGLSVWRV
jgi:hypothetical protein